MDLMFDVMTGFGLAAIAGILLYLHTALSHPPQERRRGRHGPARPTALSTSPTPRSTLE